MLANRSWAYRDRPVPVATIEPLCRLAWLIDAMGRVPGTWLRSGINRVIGLAPGMGDAILALISLCFEAAGLGLTRLNLARMLGNIAIGAFLRSRAANERSVHMIWKANLRNVEIIDCHLGLLSK